MARKDDKAQEAKAEPKRAETPPGDVTLESGAEGADLAATASSPDLATPAGAGTDEGAAEATAEEQGVHEAEAAAAAQPRPDIRRYRPSDDYSEGDWIYHPVWDAVGTVVRRDARERIFRLPVGRLEERVRCHLISVEFQKEVPASGGPRREVTLIADWRGKMFDVGAPAAKLPEPGPLLELPAAGEERPAAARTRPILPEIPEPEATLEADEFGEDETEEEDIEPVGI